MNVAGRGSCLECRRPILSDTKSMLMIQHTAVSPAPALSAAPAINLAFAGVTV